MREYILCYALYAVILVMSYFVLFIIWRTTLANLIVVMIGREFSNRSVYLASVLVMGIIGFIYVLASEVYLRHGTEQRQLIPRFARLAVPLGLFGLVGALVGRWASAAAEAIVR